MNVLEALSHEFSCYYLADELPCPFEGDALASWVQESAVRLKRNCRHEVESLKTVLLEVSKSRKSTNIVKILGTSNDVFSMPLDDDKWHLFSTITALILANLNADNNTQLSGQ